MINKKFIKIKKKILNITKFNLKSNEKKNQNQNEKEGK